MPEYAAFLRAVNVGGRTISMADLRKALESAGYEQVGTVLQSGTAVFSASKARASELEHDLEALILRRFKIDVPVIVRTAAQMKKLVANNPFRAEAKNDPARLVAIVLKSAPPKAKVDALRAAIRGREEIAIDGDVLYAYYPDGQGTSKLGAAVIDRALETVVTARNWNTIGKIVTALQQRSL